MKAFLPRTWVDDGGPFSVPSDTREGIQVEGRVCQSTATHGGLTGIPREGVQPLQGRGRGGTGGGRGGAARDGPRLRAGESVVLPA